MLVYRCVGEEEPRGWIDLGDARTARLQDIRWPSGVRRDLHDRRADQSVHITEQGSAVGGLAVPR